MITGHSLGGGIATHAFVQFRKSGINVDEFITYESPRVGDAKFAEWVRRAFPQQKYRITHSHDPVPHLPIDIQGFKHVDAEVYYPNLYHIILYQLNRS